MIDERKIKRELSGLIRSTQEGTIEHKIYQTFLAYISRQKVISFMTLRFYGRMERYLAAAGGMETEGSGYRKERADEQRITEKEKADAAVRI